MKLLRHLIYACSAFSSRHKSKAWVSSPLRLQRKPNKLPHVLWWQLQSAIQKVQSFPSLPPSFCFAFSLSHYLFLYFDCVRNVNESFDSAKCNITSSVAQNSAIYPIKMMNKITSSEGNNFWKCAQTCPNAVSENPNKRLAALSRICHSKKA